MHISEISIEGYKSCKEKSIVQFNKGLNIIVGENASGKTTIIDALRMILKENEIGYISDNDFYKSFDKNDEKKNINIDLKFINLSREEKVTFLTWCNSDFNAELHLKVEKRPNIKGYYKKSIWGGKSKASAFEEETFDYIETIYLPALRNAEEKLKNGRKSRLALLLEHHYLSDERKEELVQSFSEFNHSVVSNKDDKYKELGEAKDHINDAIKNSMGNVFGQSINLQFSESSFSSILQSIKMVFFPHIGEQDENKFRDIAINSLGYNNLLYIATVFAELEIIKANNDLLTVLLIEEPEAHLHPQIQSKLIKYLKQISDDKNNLQIIVTTHSSVIASSVDINSLIYVTNKDKGILSLRISDFNLEDNVKRYLNRWMDITKSTMLFSKGIILVEGICEAMILPVLAPKVLEEYNANHDKPIPTSLEDAGVSVININGINFKYFYPLFADLSDNQGRRLPIRCSGVTDFDPESTNGEQCFPVESDINNSSNQATCLQNVLKKTEYARLYVSPLKTFEYDFAMAGNFSLMAEVLKEIWPTRDETVGVKKDCEEIRNRDNVYGSDEDKKDDAKFILKRIEDSKITKGVFSQQLSQKIENGSKVNVPDYLKQAIIWACGGICDE